MTGSIMQRYQSFEMPIQGDWATQCVGLADGPTCKPWSVRELAAICERRHIWYKETCKFTTLLGIVVSCGGTSVIDISAELTEREKISAIAHQLGHIALGHMRRKPIRFLRAMDELPARNSNDTEEEMEACAWAAHLLVQRELYEAKLDQAQLAHEGDPGQAAKCAIAMTADALNITPLTVSCRLEHEDANFPVPPLEWLQGQC